MRLTVAVHALATLLASVTSQSPAQREPVAAAWRGKPPIALRGAALACRIDATLAEAQSLAAVPSVQARFLGAQADACVTLPRGLPVAVRRTVRDRAAVDVAMPAARAAGADRYAGAWWVPLDAIRPD